MLSLDQGFTPLDMYAVSQITSNKRFLNNFMHSSPDVNDLKIMETGFVRLPIANDGISRKTAVKEHFIMTLKDQFVIAEKTTDCPKRILFPVLDEEHGHWFTICIDITKDNDSINLGVIESTRKLDNHKLREILTENVETIGAFINEALLQTNLNKLKIEQNNVSYCQSLQYGQKGCGFVSTLNIDEILNGELSLEEKCFKEEDFSELEGRRIIYENDSGEYKSIFLPESSVQNIICFDFESDQLIPNDLKMLIRHDKHFEVSDPVTETKMEQSGKNRIMRNTLLMDVMRRAQVYIAISTQKSLHDDLYRRKGPGK